MVGYLHISVSDAVNERQSADVEDAPAPLDLTPANRHIVQRQVAEVGDAEDAEFEEFFGSASLDGRADAVDREKKQKHQQTLANLPF